MVDGTTTILTADPATAPPRTRPGRPGNGPAPFPAMAAAMGCWSPGRAEPRRAQTIENAADLFNRFGQAIAEVADRFHELLLNGIAARP